MYLNRVAVTITALIVLTGCSQGSYLLLGTTRDPIRPEQVLIYEQEPLEYEVIALLTAKAKNAANYQSKMNYAIKKLKSQAASIGANGILLEEIHDVFVSSAGSNTKTYKTKGVSMGRSGTEVVLKGKAIFVPNQ